MLIAEFVIVDRTDPAWDLAALALTALAYALALMLFALLRSLGARAVLSASLGSLVAAALALRLFALKAAPLGPCRAVRRRGRPGDGRGHLGPRLLAGVAQQRGAAGDDPVLPGGGPGAAAPGRPARPAAFGWNTR